MDREHLITKAAEAALVFNRQLNILLDVYDFYIQRYPVDTPSAKLELKDVQVSIKELGILPHSIAARLEAWKKNQVPSISAEGFELYVLNEFILHMRSLHMFMVRKHLDTNPFDAQELNTAATTFNRINRKLSTNEIN